MSDSVRPHGLPPTRLLCPGIFQARVLEWGAIAFSDNVHSPLQNQNVERYCNGSFYMSTWLDHGAQIWAQILGYFDDINI